ncbi:single-stranded DNA-binding protein [Peptoclostridium acidaminophilum]|nr:single-stranded DNA-binding protein [Peptoclostridium acidaminophilum]
MDNKSVQILFTDKQYQDLEKKAAKAGLTVPLYIKGIVLENDEFSLAYAKLIKKVDALPSGTRFTIRSLFGTEWTMGRGIKLSLGKTYYNQVEKKTINNVNAEGKDSSNVMWYVKL